MFFVIPEMPSKTFVMVFKTNPDHFKWSREYVGFLVYISLLFLYMSKREGPLVCTGTKNVQNLKKRKTPHAFCTTSVLHVQEV